jgi:hypothetical protein
MNSKELDTALTAIQAIRTQTDLNVLAQAWRDQQTFIATRIGRMVKKGDTVQWENKGVVKTGTIVKMNKKTCEIQNAGATPFGRTVTKIYNSMIVGKV